MGTLNRRCGFRIPLQIFMNQYLEDKPHRCMVTNVSPNGLYINRLTGVAGGRSGDTVGVEFELPGTSEVIWARGEIRFSDTDHYFHGTGVELTGITRFHERLMRDYVMDQRTLQLRRLLALVRRNRMH